TSTDSGWVAATSTVQTRSSPIFTSTRREVAANSEVCQRTTGGTQETTTVSTAASQSSRTVPGASSFRATISAAAPNTQTENRTVPPNTTGWRRVRKR